MTDNNPDSSKASSLDDHVSFGPKTMINPNMRLPRFDNGAAKAYQAYDPNDKTKKQIALVAGIESLPRWSATVIYDKLADTSFMRLMGSGVVHWPLENVQKFILIYAGNVGDTLVERDGFNQTSWRHPDIVDRLIFPMARMLKEMEDKSFTHGSIRPSNIFHGSADKTAPVILGDCLAVQPGSSQSSIFLPIEKALAEPMARGKGSIKDDIFAFGVSLVFFLRKNDELKHIGEDELLKRRIENGTFATLIGGERFQASFLELLRGILHDDPDQRWSLDDLFAWLDGTRLTPPPHVKPKKANRPITFGGKKYLYPQLLALDIQKFPHDIAEAIEDGSFAQWIDKAVDDNHLTERYAKATERIAGMGSITDNKDYMVTQLKMALNPALPIYYKGRVFVNDGLGAMLAQDIYADRDLNFYREVFKLNIPDQNMSVKGASQNALMINLKLYDSCRASINNLRVGYGIERCVYMLCKDTPCLSPKLKGYFVNGHRAALFSFEKICAGGKEVALLLDRHAVAFFSVLDGGLVERSLYDLNETDKKLQIMGNLRLFATVQERAKGMHAYALAAVFMDSMKDVYKGYKNRALRKKIQDGVEAAAKDGDLVTMSSILDDELIAKKDEIAFQRARYEFKQLQREYSEYNRRLGNKATYGVTNGRDAAAIVSWVVATIITLIVVFAHLSGYRMY